MNKKLLQLGALLFFLAYKPFSCSALYSTHTTPTYSKKQRKQYYSHAGILPILEHNNKKYMVLGKLPGKLHFYGDFGGTQVKKDNNNPVWTAARNFSTRSNSSYEDIFAILKNQCNQASCVLKANNGRYIVYPLEISLKNLDPLKKLNTSSDMLSNHPFYSFIELSTLEKEMSNLSKNVQAKDLQIKTNNGKVITIRSELVEALLNKPNFFQRFNK